ncbi:hypothetical protein [Lentzea sp. E54]|uniref:hypothetical protein n=1 Tax=Lentzea xerophila TaxID=3435883 RepID=UPI003DA25304
MLTIGVGQHESRPIAAELAAQTVAGIGVAGESADRARAVDELGLAGLILVVVEAVG